MSARYVLAFAALSLLAACGSATDSLTFQAPPSYHEKGSVGPFMKIWEGAPHNAIIVMSLPVQIDLDKAMSQAQLKNAEVEKRENLTICNGQRAVYALMRGEANTGDQSSSEPAEIQFVATDVNGKTVMAMYARPLKSPADAEASAAIKNLCPK